MSDLSNIRQKSYYNYNNYNQNVDSSQDISIKTSRNFETAGSVARSLNSESAGSVAFQGKNNDMTQKLSISSLPCDTVSFNSSNNETTGSVAKSSNTNFETAGSVARSSNTNFDTAGSIARSLNSESAGSVAKHKAKNNSFGCGYYSSPYGYYGVYPNVGNYPAPYESFKYSQPAEVVQKDNKIVAPLLITGLTILGLSLITKIKR